MDAAHAVECPLDPRVERTRRVVLEATTELLAEEGYGAVTIEAVAARSGVAKSTIYRHWPGRVELINDAFQALKLPMPDSTEGSVRDQVIARLEHLARSLTGSRWSSCLPTLIDAAEHDPEARALHGRLTSAGRQAMVDLLREGVEKGEFPADLDPEVMVDALAGPIFLRRLMSPDAPFDPASVRHLVDQLLPSHERTQQHA
jgi:AcrR family transcriptional regulator